jgi:hypothetical protein
MHAPPSFILRDEAHATVQRFPKTRDVAKTPHGAVRARHSPSSTPLPAAQAARLSSLLLIGFLHEHRQNPSLGVGSGTHRIPNFQGLMAMPGGFVPV